MKSIALALTLALGLPGLAHAQSLGPESSAHDTTIIPPSTAPATAPAPVAAPSTAVIEAKPDVGGDLRAPSPKIFDTNRRGYFQAAVGPAYGIGFVSDSLMYNVLASYNFNLDDRITVRGLGDMYFASGSVSSRMLNLGVGADVYLPEANPFANNILPYVGADLALSNARNSEDKTASGLAIGAATGFKFQAAQLNWDINLHYAILTEQISSRNPSVLGLRAALNF